MFRSVIISPDQELGARLGSALDATSFVEILRIHDQYPAGSDLIRSLRAQAVDVVFLSFHSLAKAQLTVKLLESEVPHVQVVGIHSHMDPAVMRESMRLGLREFLVNPFERRFIMESLTHLKEMLDRRPVSYETTDQIYTFLPSKAGVGTSTIATNMSAAMARLPKTRVMLTDFDLNSGMLRFMLKLTNTHSVVDAVEHAGHIDENLWPQLVTRMGEMDVLHAGRINPACRIEPMQIRDLVNFMRRNYQAVCFDLSGNLERYSLELMQESKRIFLVCTPEFPSLHLAREKLQFLREIDLEKRVSVILNRVPKKPLFTAPQVEELLGVKVLRVFPNDYVGVNTAMTEGTLVNPTSEIGKAFMEFAATLLSPIPTAAPVESKRKFMEMFSIPSPALVPRTK